MSNKKIDRREFLAEIIISKGLGKLTHRAEHLMILLAKKAITKMTYYDTELAKDCIQTAYVNMFANWQSFNPQKTNNAFAYFTEVFKRGAAQGLNDWTVRRGDTDKSTKVYYMNSINDGEGMYNLIS